MKETKKQTMVRDHCLPDLVQLFELIVKNYL